MADSKQASPKSKPKSRGKTKASAAIAGPKRKPSAERSPRNNGSATARGAGARADREPNTAGNDDATSKASGPGQQATPGQGQAAETTRPPFATILWTASAVIFFAFAGLACIVTLGVLAFANVVARAFDAPFIGELSKAIEAVVAYLDQVIGFIKAPSEDLPFPFRPLDQGGGNRRP